MEWCAKQREVPNIPMIVCNSSMPAATFVTLPILRRWDAYVVAIAIAACLLLSACAPMRVYPNGTVVSGLDALKSEPLSDVTPDLPADLRTSSDEVLVLIQTSRYTYSGVGAGGSAGGVAANSVAARFMKGNELPSLSQTVTLSSGGGVVFFIPLMVAGIPLGGGSTYDRLEVLCVVAQDGRVVELYPNAQRRHQSFTTAKIETIVSALSVTADASFTGAEAPCGVVGTLGWSDQLRSKVSDFIVRLPTSDPNSH